MSKSKLYDSATEAKYRLDEIQKGINDLLPKLKDAKDQDILLVLGNTRVGKSTLVSYLSGTKLVGKEDPDDPDEVLLCLDAISTGAEIGHGVSSQTKTPTKHIATKVTNMQLWDVPGFNESSTREQDIINTYLIQELMTRAQSIRIVLVASYSHISVVEAVKPFCEFLSTIATIFPNLDQVQDKFTIVFTKAPSNTNASKLSSLLKSKVLNPTSNGKIDNYYGSAEKREKCKPIIEHFVKNPDKIGVFVRPDIAGPIEDKVINPDNNISKTILSSSQVKSSQLKDVKIGAHPDSITFVRENLKTIGEYYKTIVQSKVKNQIDLSLSRIEDAYKERDYKKLLDIRSELVKIQNFVVKEKNSREALESLCKMNEVPPDKELISFSETIKHCTAMLKKGIGEPTLDDLLLIQLSLQLNAVSAKLQINQARYLRDQGNLDKLTCDKLIEEATKKAAQVESKLHDVEKEMIVKSTTLRQIGEGALEVGAKVLAAAGGVLISLIFGVIKPIADAKDDIEKSEGFLETTGAVVKGVVCAPYRVASGFIEGVTEAI